MQTKIQTHTIPTSFYNTALKEGTQGLLNYKHDKLSPHPPLFEQELLLVGRISLEAFLIFRKTYISLKQHYIKNLSQVERK